MTKIGKRLKKAIAERVEGVLSLGTALEALKDYKKHAAKFDESVEIVFKLGIDPRQSSQMVRGSTTMPKGLGKVKRIAVFTTSERVKEALDAGADVAGSEDLIEAVKGGRDDFDICIATPDMMPKMAALGKILGTKGKMPNPKLGTVNNDIKVAVGQAKRGMVEFRVEKGALIHAGVGKLSFPKEDLLENIVTLYDAIVAAKPTDSKGTYIQRMHLSTSQGPSMQIDVNKIT